MLLSVASFIYLLGLSAAYKSPAPCDATQDFSYPAGRILSTLAPFLLIAAFYFLFKTRFIVTKRKLLLSAAIVAAVIFAALVFTAAVYVFLFPFLEQRTSGSMHRLISYYDCYGAVGPSDLLTNISFVTGLFTCFKIALGIADRVARKKRANAE